mgnify:FL=1|jgi:hypothetical protein|tara:strand:+ start:161 stop:508 length:348 start_codon:yes stop_codon:yes gene_type:complete
MSTGDTTARNSRASDFSADYTTASLLIKVGATTVATHTLAGFGAPATGVITADPIADETYSAGGTISSAELTDAAGTYTLTVGIAASGADVIFDTLTAVLGGTSKINSLAVTFPA